MALLDPWDPVLEALTLRLVDITDGRVARGCAVSWNDGGWQLRFRGHRRALDVGIGALKRGDDLLNDYELSLLYGLGFGKRGADDQQPEFVRGLKLRDGGRWDEQTLREVVLEGLAILRYVLRCPGPDALALQGIKVAG